MASDDGNSHFSVIQWSTIVYNDDGEDEDDMLNKSDENIRRNAETKVEIVLESNEGS